MNDAKKGWVIGLQAAERKGRTAYREHVAKSSNPYRRFEHRKAWDDGWEKARHQWAAATAASLARSC